MSIRRGRGSVPKGGCSIKNHPVNTTQPLQKSVGRQVAQFAVPGFIALVALAIVSYVIAQRVAADEALRDATELAEVMARAAVEPELEGPTSLVRWGCPDWTDWPGRNCWLIRSWRSACGPTTGPLCMQRSRG